MHAGATTFANDIAVIKLSAAVSGTNIKPIDRGSANTGDVINVAGWGQTYNNGPLPDQMQEFNSTAISRSACQSRNSNPVSDGHICVWNGLEGHCVVSACNSATPRSKYISNHRETRVRPW